MNASSGGAGVGEGVESLNQHQGDEAADMATDPPPEADTSQDGAPSDFDKDKAQGGDMHAQDHIAFVQQPPAPRLADGPAGAPAGDDIPEALLFTPPNLHQMRSQQQSAEGDATSARQQDQMVGKNHGWLAAEQAAQIMHPLKVPAHAAEGFAPGTSGQQLGHIGMEDQPWAAQHAHNTQSEHLMSVAVRDLGYQEAFTATDPKAALMGRAGSIYSPATNWSSDGPVTIQLTPIASDDLPLQHDLGQIRDARLPPAILTAHGEGDLVVQSDEAAEYDALGRPRADTSVTAGIAASPTSIGRNFQSHQASGLPSTQAPGQDVLAHNSVDDAAAIRLVDATANQRQDWSQGKQMPAPRASDLSTWRVVGYPDRSRGSDHQPNDGLTAVAETQSTSRSSINQIGEARTATFSSVAAPEQPGINQLANMSAQPPDGGNTDAVDINSIHVSGPADTSSHASAASGSSQTTSTPPVARQLAEAIIRSGPEPGQTELVLSPEELGRVQFSIRNVDGQLSVIISAERPETMILMRRNADLLTAELAQSGMGGAALDFGGGGQAADRGARSTREIASGSAHAKDNKALPAETGQGASLTGSTFTGGRINIRL